MLEYKGQYILVNNIAIYIFMMNQIVRSHIFQKLGTVFIPALTWVIILMPLWLSPFHPAVVAYFIIAFDLYFLIKSVITAYYATLSYSLIRSFQNVEFDKYLKSSKQASGLTHFIIIPNYKEPINKLNDTLEAISKNIYPFDSIHIVLACETREDNIKSKAQILQNQWQNSFKSFHCVYHTLSGKEVPGKASNQTYAARFVEKYCIENKLDFKNTLITICDADSLLPKNYFSYLSYEFLNDINRQYHFYWAPVLLYNNFWKLPFFVRMQATLSSILRLAFLSQKNNLIHISTYTTNLWMLKELDYWDVDIIPEDWHIFYQAFFKFGKNVKTLPLYTIVNSDAVFSGSLVKTFVNRYEQEKRWAWGVTDISYFWNNMFLAKHIPWAVRLSRLTYLIETHLLWPTSFFVLTISGWIPAIVNPVFKRTVLGFILPNLTGLILTLATVMLILYVYLDHRLRAKLNQKTEFKKMPLLLIQWYLLPIVSFVLSSLPALDAHTRLLIGKKLKYKVTEKA